jgi:hypothetical protein
MWQHGRLRDYATSRKVISSLPNEVTGFLNWSNPSSCTVALRSTQPPTEMSTRNLCGGSLCARLATSPPSVSCLGTVGASIPHNPWASTACYRVSFTLFCTLRILVCPSSLTSSHQRLVSGQRCTVLKIYHSVLRGTGLILWSLSALVSYTLL